MAVDEEKYNKQIYLNALQFYKYLNENNRATEESGPVWVEPWSVVCSPNKLGEEQPSYKSPLTIINKLIRLKEKGKKFGVDAGYDLTRCAIIIPDYSYSIPVIKALKKRMPGLRGDFNDYRDSLGYVGLHVNGFSKTGIPFEIQISTPPAWCIKQAGENCYSYWRNFNPQKEQEQIHLLYTSGVCSFEDYQRGQEFIKIKVAMRLEDARKSRMLYSTLDISKLLENREELCALLDAYEQSAKSNTISPILLQELDIDRYIRQGNLDRLGLAVNIENKLGVVLAQSQQELVDICNEVCEEQKMQQTER